MITRRGFIEKESLETFSRKRVLQTGKSQGINKVHPGLVFWDPLSYLDAYTGSGSVR